MCDTLVALPDITEKGSTIFAKNSDRDPNEAHEVIIVPAASHGAGETVQCTYVEIPQVGRTLSVLLAKPFWIWGAEMGANEKGVVIGNEALFTRVEKGKDPGLIGMDFLRLALERAESAFQAVQVITKLLEQYGQSGNCGFNNPMYYDNSYLIADPHESWVLETAGYQWAAVKVKNYYAISNIITIQTEWDLASTDLVNYAKDRGWYRKNQTFNFSQCYSEPIYSTLGAGNHRRACTLDILRQQRGKINAATLMTALRAHGFTENPGWRPDLSLLGAEVCMHAGFGPVRISQTTGSMVSEITKDIATHWVTATSTPCLSVFKPVWLDSGLPETSSTLTGIYNPDLLWWQHEKLHRLVCQDYPNRAAVVRGERDQIERDFLIKAAELCSSGTEPRSLFTKECFDIAQSNLQRWTERVSKMPRNNPAVFYYTSAWKSHNRAAKLE